MSPFSFTPPGTFATGVLSCLPLTVNGKSSSSEAASACARRPMRPLTFSLPTNSSFSVQTRVWAPDATEHVPPTTPFSSLSSNESIDCGLKVSGKSTSKVSPALKGPLASQFMRTSTTLPSTSSEPSPCFAIVTSEMVTSTGSAFAIGICFKPNAPANAMATTVTKAMSVRRRPADMPAAR